MKLSQRYKGFSEKRKLGDTFFYPGLVNWEMDYKGQEAFHTVKSGEEDRLDIISYVYYNTPDYWWVIAAYNKIKDPIFSLEPGMMIRVPMELNKVLSSYYRIGT
jgi:nucleoid-associated protein YgaU